MMKNVNVNAKEIIKELGKPKRKRVSLYVNAALYDAVQKASGGEISGVTERLWERFMASLGKTDK
jgi:hypothetical protein